MWKFSGFFRLCDRKVKIFRWGRNKSHSTTFILTLVKQMLDSLTAFWVSTKERVNNGLIIYENDLLRLVKQEKDRKPTIRTKKHGGHGSSLYQSNPSWFFPYDWTTIITESEESEDVLLPQTPQTCSGGFSQDCRRLRTHTPACTVACTPLLSAWIKLRCPRPSGLVLETDEANTTTTKSSTVSGVYVEAGPVRNASDAV